MKWEVRDGVDALLAGLYAEPGDSIMAASYKLADLTTETMAVRKVAIHVRVEGDEYGELLDAVLWEMER